MVRLASASSAPADPAPVLEDWTDDPRGWDFLGTVPVPIRQRIRDGLDDCIAAEGGPLRSCFLMGQGGASPLNRLRFVRRIEDFPGMLVSSEHGNIFNRDFQKRHVGRGAFEACQPPDGAAAFRTCGLIDPKGIVGVFAVAPFVLLVDRMRLGRLPVPRRWSDLMEPEYLGQVVFGGWQRQGETRYRQYNKFFLLCIAREFGLDGVRRLVANVPMLMHSAQMPRFAGSNASAGGIYVLPWSLADLCPRRNVTEVVWPEDGALAYPLWLTVQAARRRRSEFMVRYFFGRRLADYLDANRYPSLAAGRPAAIPAGAALKWPGWDFVRHRSCAETVKACTAIFRDSRRSTEVAKCA
jgi:ABC-type Fe3+ transport system substrate-binding protein